MPTVGMKLLHSSLNLLLLLLLLLLFSCCPEKNDASSDIEFHTLDISSAAADSSSPSECRRRSSTTGLHEMEVVDMKGACGIQQNHGRPTLAQILQLDQLQAESIQARLEATDQLQNAKLESQDNHSTVQFHSDSFPYIVQLNVLGRQQPLSLLLDIASGITITQTLSGLGSWYSPIRCNDSVCSDFIESHSDPGMPVPSSSEICAESSTCDFELFYAGNPLGSGTLGKVDLTDFPDFLLWCGSNLKSSDDDSVDGVLGLGRRSFHVSQTNGFSYCLPSNSSSTGYFTFAKNNTPAHDHNKLLLFTPFVNPPDLDGSLYFVEIVAITVGKTKLQINYTSDIRGTVIQTAVQITRLPQDAYSKLSDEFKRQMGTDYPAAEAFSIFDTCFDTTNHSSITVPPVSFTFGNNVMVHLDVSGILYVVNSNLSCLAFAQTSNPRRFAIFGSVQQRTLEMVFDVANGMLGFGQNGCA